MRSVWIVLICAAGAASPLAAQEGRAVRENAGGRAPVEAVLAPARSLGSVPLDNGNTIEFLEPEPGVVFVMETGKYPQEPVLPRLPLRADATPADVYRMVAPGRAVPRAVRRARFAVPDDSEEERTPEVSEEGQLLEIEARPAAPALEPVPARPVLQAVPARPANEAPLDPKEEAPVEPKAGEQEAADIPKPPEDVLRAEWFQSKFCGSGAAVSWCWVNRSGVSTKEAWGIGIGAVAFSCGGTAHFRLEYRRLGKWKSYASYDVLPGYYRTVSRWGVPRTRRSRVEGSCFHHAGEGFL